MRDAVGLPLRGRTSIVVDSLLPFRAREYLKGRLDRLRFAALASGGTEYTFAPFLRHDCLFVHVPKAAGLSVAYSLFGCKAGGHRSLRRYRVALGGEFVDRAFKFTVVRNPWERLVSAFFFLKQGGTTPADAFWAQRHLADYQEFDDFVTRWLSRARAGTEPHFVPQSWFLQGCNRIIGVDYVARLETLPQDFATIAGRLGISARLADLNRSEHGHYRDYYSVRARRIVADVYHEDLEMLGYEF